MRLNKKKEANKNKIKNKSRVPFILFCMIPPLISFLIFYVYVNFSAFGMAFTNSLGEFSLEHFARIWREIQLPTSQIREAFVNTLITFGVLLVAYPFKVLVSYFIYKKIPFAGFYRVVFFLPTIIFSVCIALVFDRMIGPSGIIAEWVGKLCHLDYTPELLADTRFANTVVLLHMLWLGFPGDLIIWGGTFARVSEEVLESGRIDGTNWWTEFTKIIVPMVWPTVALQMILMFCGLFNSSGQVFLLTGGQYGTMTVSAWMYVYLQEHSGANYTSSVYNFMSAFGLVISVIAIAISMIIRRFSGKVYNDVEF